MKYSPPNYNSLDTTDPKSGEAKKFTNHVRVGRPTKYRPDEHIELLFKVFKEGEGVSAFCAEALIGRKTFYDWLQLFPDFREAYDIALNVSARIWEAYPLINKDISFQYWATIMRTRFKHGRFKIKPVAKENGKEATPLDKIDAVWKSLEEGEIASVDLGRIVGLITAEATLKANIPMENDFIAKRESNEELMEKVQAIKEVLENVNTRNKNEE